MNSTNIARIPRTNRLMDLLVLVPSFAQDTQRRISITLRFGFSLTCTMRSPIRLSVRSSRLPNHRSRRFISRHPALLIALVLAAAAVFVFVGHSSAAGGDIDPAFNAGGAGAVGVVRAVAVQPDGKIVIGGGFTSYNGDAAASDKVMRLNADGTSDTTFNAGGAGANSTVGAVAVQPDGKIVIGGFFTSYNGDAAVPDYVIRLQPTPPTAANGSIFGQIADSSGAPLAGTTINLSGTQNRETITDAHGKYSFDGVETNGFYTVTPSRANYIFSPGERSFTLLGNKTDALFTAAQTMETGNPLDTPEFFVRQQYLDFLNREPEQDGLDYWSGQLRSCATDQRCVNGRRIAVSGAFFVEQEFQQTGSFIYRLYKASLGRQPSYAEFSADRSKVVGGATLAEMQHAFADEWVLRDAFKQQYPDTMAAADFVNRLFDTASLQAYDARQQQIEAMANGKTRAAVLRDVIDIAEFKTREYNPSFVLMQYFGYLRREADRDGYNFWLDVVNNRDPGNYRGMVCAFITSAEYQQRFSSVVTHTNAECSR